MLRRTLLLFSVKFPLKSRGAMLLGTSCNLSQSSNQTSLLELCSDLRRKEFKDYDHLFISAELSQLADRNGVTLRIYHRLVESMEQRKIIQNATRKNKLKSSGNDVNETIEAQGNLQDVVTLMANLRKNKEALLHCSVFIELKAKSKQKLKELQTDIAMELTRSKIEVDRLTLRQKEGFLSVNPIGSNQFGLLYERVLPASSVANLFPFNFSGKTDPNGLYIGRDKYDTNILVDFDRRT